jgi:mono/diheme cytochrome c family protein
VSDDPPGGSTEKGPNVNESSKLGIALCAIGAAFSLGSPLFAADASNGKRLAERWCTGCHLVSSSQSTATDQVPPFAAIAKMPNFSAAKIALFLLDPHPKMPNMGLSRTEAADLAAYIATLK